MKKLFTLLLLLLHVLRCYSQQQSIQIDPLTINAYCPGSEVFLNFKTNEIFGANNKFQVQLARYGAGSCYNVSTTFVNGRLSFIVPTIVETTLSETSYIHTLRVLATNPSVKSNDVVFYVNLLPKVSIAGEVTVNPYSPVSFEVKGVGTRPMNLLMSDSSIYEFPQYIPAFIKVTPTKSTTFKLISVVNNCGIGTASGTFSIKVNPIALKIVSVSVNGNFCRGNDFLVTVSKSNNFEKSNKYTIQAQGGDSVPFVSFPTEAIADTVLKVTVPEDFKNSIRQLRVIATNPEVIGEAKDVNINLVDASAEMFYSKTPWSINKSIGIRFKGVAPFQATLNNGTIIYSNSFSEEVTVSRFIPENSQPNNYKIVSAKSGCGNLKIANNFSYNVTADSLYFIDVENFAGYYGFCKNNGSLKLPIRTNIPNLSANNGFKIRFLSADWYGNSSTIKEVNATLSNDGKNIIATIPNDLYKNYPSTVFRYQIVISSPNVTGPERDLQIYDTPSLKSIYGDKNIDKPESVDIGFNLGGGVPNAVELTDGTKEVFELNYSSFSIPVFPIKTTIYSIKSITNSCGTINNPTINTSGNSSITIKVQKPNKYSIKLKDLLKNNFCVGESFDVNFETDGDLPPNSKYTVEIVSRGNTTKSIIGSGNQSPIKITIPSDVSLLGKSTNEIFYQKIRVITEDKEVQSNEVLINVSTKPKAQVTTRDNGNGAAIKNGVLDLYVELSGGGTFYKYKFDEEPETTYILPWGNQPNSSNYNISFIPKRTGNFNLKYVSNECCVGTIDSKGFDVAPFYIENYVTNTVYCTGTSSLIPIKYAIVGDAKPDLRVQIAQSNSEAYTDIPIVQQGNPMLVQIPDGLSNTNNEFKLRIYDKNTTIFSQTRNFGLSSHPTVSFLTKEGTTTGTLLSHEKEYSCIQTRGTNLSNAYVWIEGVGSVIGYGCFSVSPTVNTTYRVEKISSVCGYTNSTATVTINIQKSIILGTLTNYNVCSGSKFTIPYTIRGDYDSNTKFEFYLETSDTKSERTKLGSVTNKSGNITLAVPTDIKNGAYKFFLLASGSVSSSPIYLNVLTKPIVSLSGNSIINPTQSTNIRINSTEFIGQVSYLLSDGTSGTLYSGSNLISVSPSVTTTYQIKTIWNACGNGTATGQATVVVNPPSNKQINGIGLNRQNVCINDYVIVNFSTLGTSSSAIYTVLLSDKNGENFKKINAKKQGGYFEVTIPESTPEGSDYRIKLESDEANVASSTSVIPINIIAGISVTVKAEKTFISDNSPAKINFNFIGNPPFYLVFDDSTATNQRYYQVSTNQLSVNLSKIGNYKVFQIANTQCSNGIVKGDNPIKIELLTASNEPIDSNISIYPNPVIEKIELKNIYNYKSLTIRDLRGISFDKINLNNQDNLSIDFSNYVAGTYILELESAHKRSQSYKIVKQ